VLVTGGTSSLGKSVVRRLLTARPREKIHEIMVSEYSSKDSVVWLVEAQALLRKAGYST